MRRIAIALTAVALLGLAVSTAQAHGYGHRSSGRTVITLRHPAYHGRYHGYYPGYYGAYRPGCHWGGSATYYYAPYAPAYRSYGYYGYPYYGYYSRPYASFGYYGPGVGISVGF